MAYRRAGFAAIGAVKVLIDMNISPLCAPAIAAAGHEAWHWSRVGPPNATDTELMAWACERDMVVLTHDLDFGDILGAGGAKGPSVIQLRADRLAIDVMSVLVVSALRDYQAELEAGALLTVDAARLRVRLLPIDRPAAPDRD
jgi:predicted nuclease of predicted toxin-antitoxin system